MMTLEREKHTHVSQRPIHIIPTPRSEETLVSPDEHTPAPPPDGGYGWVCVASLFFINGFTWGVVASYSVYLSHYLTHSLFPTATPLDYAFIGGFNFSFAVLMAPLTTLLIRISSIRTPMFLGVILLPLGLITASFSTQIWHLYLTQGLCIGVAVGLIYIPATAIIPQWFLRRRSLASGICAAGSGIGGLIVCFSTSAMLRDLGLPWTLRITAVVVFIVNGVATALIRSRDDEIRPDERIFNFHLLQRRDVQLLLAWSFIMMFGYTTLMFSLSDYAVVIGRSSADSATVAAMLNLGAAFGRPAIGWASDRWGRVEVASVLTAACGVAVFGVWVPGGDGYAVLVFFAVASGSILGVFWAVIAPLAADLVGLKELPACLSLVWLSVVLPTAFAETIALKLRRPGKGARTYLYAQIFAGVSYIAASFFLFWLWRLRRGEEIVGAVPGDSSEEEEVAVIEVESRASGREEIAAAVVKT